MKSPLYNKLIEYSNQKTSFHMPGHKFGKFKGLVSSNIYQLDATEAGDLDNLYEAEGVIKEAMERMSDFYKSKESIFLTNGSTSGILTTILAVCKPGDQLLVARNCHYSVWNALIIGGITPIYIEPNYDKNIGLITEINPTNIERALQQHKKVKGAIIVSPTYEGIVSDVKKISDIMKKYNKVLIVDEAHGAHFNLSRYFPQSAITQGADLVVQSMHKTLPALTQSALLHIGTDQIDSKHIINTLKLTQTSSPSYALMTTMDNLRSYLEENREEIMDIYIKELSKCRKRLADLKYLSLFDEDNTRYDKSKLIVLTSGSNIDGYQLGEILENRYNIGIEAATPNYITLISTIADDSFVLNKLATALLEIDTTLKSNEELDIIDYNVFNENIVQGNNIRDIYYAEKELVEVSECIGRISSKNIMLYPPGIPIICMGENIKKHHYKSLQDLKDKLLGVQIAKNGKIFVEVIKQ